MRSYIPPRVIGSQRLAMRSTCPTFRRFRLRYSFSPTPHPFLPYVAPHISHISHFNLFSQADSALLEFGREGLNLPPVLPLPRLLPSWAQLQSALPLDLQREDWQRWQLAANTDWRAPSASEGATRAVALMGTGGGILTVGTVALIWLRGRARYSAK